MLAGERVPYTEKPHVLISLRLGLVMTELSWGLWVVLGAGWSPRHLLVSSTCGGELVLGYQTLASLTIK